MELKFLYRDTTQPEDIINKYQPGANIIERGFTDTSKLRGGPSGNLRYLIASNKGKDLAGISENADKWEMVIFQSDTIFTVIDTYKRDGITQVLLVTEQLAADEDIVVRARQDLDELIDQQPVQELISEDWKERVVHPLGLDENGNPFPLP